ncbi:MAG: YaiI/YqxD family protein [Deltaproteobacteria bacterium]|nr:YaiI/YqxD family protein [Deltaproteobacteria bacterium]
MLDIYVDADGCPVKDEVYKVARRYGLQVYVVANRPVRVPFEPGIQAVSVGDRFDAADDWIAERAGPDDIAVTADIPLADRCLKKGARVLGPRGQPFTEETIGSALALRALLDHVRQLGEATGGPAPMGKHDRSRFLSSLDQTIQEVRRGHALD